MLREGDIVGGRYAIVAKVGSGGMSDVYKAKDNKLNRYVAVKILKQEFSEDENFVSKFRVEAQSAAGLSHPNIVNVYDVGDEEGIHYIVMELVEGITLKTYIEKKGRLSTKEAISIAIQVAKGIESAHNNHIIHRDIKPQNIIISREGKVKVTDFGIARAASSNTITSNVMGSVHYTSPEQARGGFIDEKSDIYSLGITLYEMITGRVPFDGDSAVAIAIKHLQQEIIPPGEYVEDLPISIEKIILKCTQKSSDRRYNDVDDLIKDLKHSLINPNEDFVKIIPGVTNAKTMVLSEEDLENIKNGILPGSEDDDDLEDADDYADDSQNETNRYQESEDETEDEEDLDEYEEDPDADEELNPKLDKAITVLGIVTALIIVGIVIYLVGSFFGLFDFSKSGTETSDISEISQVEEDSKKEEVEKITMISVVGSSYNDAKKQLNDLGFGIRKASEEESDVYPKGYIISQNVKKGKKVKKNTTVEVVVSSGEASVSVPSIIGLDQQSAINALNNAGLKYNTQSDYNDDYEEGLVVSSSPEPGTSVNKGDTVTILISLGSEQVYSTVPDLSRMTQAQATAALAEAGLTTGNITTEYNSDVAENLVIPNSQSVSVGEEVEQYTAVDFVVSRGEEPQPDPEYSYSTTIEEPSTGAVGKATVVLTAAGGSDVLFSKSVTLPYNLDVSGIKGADTGTLTVTWNYYEVDEETGEQAQETTQDSYTDTVSFSQVN